MARQLIRTNMDDMQLEISVSASFLKYSYDYYGCLATRSWIAETWRFLSDSRITVVDPFPKPSLACSNDCFIMERFFRHGYRGLDLLQLNYCRMHLHALLLSDLCTANGVHLTDLALEVHPDPCRSSPLSWPRTRRPSAKSRFLWRSAITTVFALSTDAQVLLLPLTPFCPSTLLSWVWQFLPSEQRLFFPNASSWDFYHVSVGRRQSRNRLCRLYRLGGLSDSLPDDSRAATVSSHGMVACLIRSLTILEQPL
jgi:hypothetical protein